MLNNILFGIPNDLVIKESFFTIALVVFLICLFLIIIMLVCMWKIYKKAGKPGWTSLIPIYNFYQLFEITFHKGWLFLILLVPFVNIVYGVLVTLRLAKVFGKSNAFGCGLLFLPWIFYPILAFGNSKYQEKGMVVNPIEQSLLSKSEITKIDPTKPPEKLNPALASLKLTATTEEKTSSPSPITSIAKNELEEKASSQGLPSITEEKDNSYKYTPKELEKPIPVSEEKALDLRELVTATMVETEHPSVEEEPQPIIIPDTAGNQKN